MRQRAPLSDRSPNRRHGGIGCASFVFGAALMSFATSARRWPRIAAGRGRSPQEPRVALVIGNSDYRSAPLDNPANDASDLAAALEKQGFNVLVRENVGERGLKEAVDVFAKHLKKGGIGLFFFAGHGVQLKDQNFLLPVDVGLRARPTSVSNRSAPNMFCHAWRRLATGSISSFSMPVATIRCSSRARPSARDSA
jgi:hypothetical protein